MLSDLDALASAAIPTSLTTLVIEGTVDPLAVARAASSTWDDISYFRSLDGQEIVGLGRAWVSTGAGEGSRFANAAADFQAAEFAPETLALVGLAFQESGTLSEEWGNFAPLEVVVPQISVHRTADGSTIAVTLQAGEDPAAVLWKLRQLQRGSDSVPVASDFRVESSPTSSQYRAAVAEGVREIDSGKLTKLVLARRLKITTDIAPDPFAVMAALGEEQPGCYLYGWKRGDTAFVGASPELLTERANGLALSVPLAGTAPRGRNDGADVQIAAALLSSDKDRHEHRVMIDDITERLGPLLDGLTISQPSVEKFRYVQHLVSRITGPVRNGETVLNLVDAIHPTPAVGGVPRDAAQMLIEKLEGFDRGWYGGAVGWMRPEGDGQLAVAIRCALLRGRESILYAGNGIVADSDPELELEETRWKFRALLRHLGEA